MEHKCNSCIKRKTCNKPANIRGYMNKKQCTACIKVTERYFCRMHKKYINKIENCDKEKVYQRKKCDICGDYMAIKRMNKNKIEYICDECKTSKIIEIQGKRNEILVS